MKWKKSGWKMGFFDRENAGKWSFHHFGILAGSGDRVGKCEIRIFGAFLYAGILGDSTLQSTTLFRHYFTGLQNRSRGKNCTAKHFLSQKRLCSFITSLLEVTRQAPFAVLNLRVASSSVYDALFCSNSNFSVIN